MKNKLLFKGKYLTILLGLILCIALFIYYNSSVKNSGEDNIVLGNEYRDEVEPESKERIIVHIAGEVNRPGIIEITSGQRLYEAIELAGSTTDKADLDMVNLAMTLEDGQKVIIPSITQGEGLDLVEQDPTININTASKSQLMELPGIGETIAENIIRYREENSGFKKIEDIKNVPRIGEATFNQLKDLISVY